MAKNPNIIFSIILLSFIILVGSISIVQVNPSKQTDSQYDDIITEISMPETSGYAVTQKWMWKNSFTGNPDAIQIEMSYDGNYIVARYETNPNVTLHRIDSNSPIWIYENTANIKDIAISGDGNYIVLCNGTHVICVDNSPEFPKKELWVHNGGPNVNFVDISLTGNYICFSNHSTIASNSDVVLLDNNGQVKWVYNNMVEIYGLAISGNGRHVIASDDDAEVHMFNTTYYDQDIPMWTYDTLGLGAKVVLSDDGDYAVAGDNSKNLYFFNTTDYNQDIPMWQWNTAGDIDDIAISSDGKYVAVADGNNFYSFNNSLSGGIKQDKWSFNVENGGADCIGINGDGTYIIGGNYFAPSAYLFNNSQGQKFPEWHGLDDIGDVAISGWGNYFVVALDNEFVSNNNEIVLFHHARPIPPVLGLILGDDDDDDDETAAIPFGNYYYVFAFGAIVALIIIIKRKTIFMIK